MKTTHPLVKITRPFAALTRSLNKTTHLTLATVLPVLATTIAAYLVTATLTTALLPTHANAAEKVRLALNWKPEPQFGGFYEMAANALGGANTIEILPGGSGQPTIQMAAAGKVEFAIVSGDELIQARANGSDVIALFAVYQTNPQGVMVHEDRGFKSLEDVWKNEGTLAMQRGLAYYDFLERQFGKPKAKVVPYAGGISAFLADSKLSQQCFVTSEPLAARKSGAKVKSFLIAESGYNPYTTVVVTRRAYMEKNKALTEKFIATVRAGWKSYLANPKATNAKMQKLNDSMDLETFDVSAAAQKELIQTIETEKNGLGTMTLARWQLLADQQLSLNRIKKKVEAKDLFVNL